MDETRDVYQQLAARAGRRLLTALADLPEFRPRPGITLGRLRVSVTVADSGLDLGSVDLDSVNVDDLAELTARRAEGLRAKHARADRPTPAPTGTAPAPVPAPSGRPALRLVGGGR